MLTDPVAEAEQALGGLYRDDVVVTVKRYDAATGRAVGILSASDVDEIRALARRYAAQKALAEVGAAHQGHLSHDVTSLCRCLALREALEKEASQ